MPCSGFFLCLVLGGFDKCIGALFYRKQPVPAIKNMELGELKYWYGHHESIVEGEKMAAREEEKKANAKKGGKKGRRRGKRR